MRPPPGAVGGTIHCLVVENHYLPIRTELGVQLDGICLLADCQLKGCDGVLRGVGTGTAMSKDRWFG